MKLKYTFENQYLNAKGSHPFANQKDCFKIGWDAAIKAIDEQLINSKLADMLSSCIKNNKIYNTTLNKKKKSKK